MGEERMRLLGFGDYWGWSIYNPDPIDKHGTSRHRHFTRTKRPDPKTRRARRRQAQASKRRNR